VRANDKGFWKLYFYIFRRDGTGFPDFEDIDTPPSSSMWNQQLDKHLE